MELLYKLLTPAWLGFDESLSTTRLCTFNLLISYLQSKASRTLKIMVINGYS